MTTQYVKIRLSGLAEALMGSSTTYAPSKEEVLKTNPLLKKYQDKLDTTKKNLITGFVACDG